MSTAFAHVTTHVHQHASFWEAYGLELVMVAVCSLGLLALRWFRDRHSKS
ncbi:hypothetical protein [Pseudobacteriovorax antillogorgiicola]|uniref:Uncharacterized protein n=1 Tax=Pseudobacteriovorax antillogorgiicola TaxID=1513793 RepID=A0A1Y6BGZ3_9BACT|nr:hypothetical protein [Pseudobacteriovorax antillogorgiicola]TCS57291.1 hypothetical protein EDD56_10331 [Pseudobacteriovorax antillogorgiicola]SMF02996.1 hypothetical protein SAMN06296036_103302 [Pseudobacteriovorax antillogorgiicola]